MDVKQFIKNNYSIILIIFIGINFRFYNFSKLASFSHDNARDIIMLYKMVNLNEIVVRGPEFSVIWGHLSPIYYYTLLPFAYILNFNPLTANFITAIIGIITIILIYFFTLQAFNKKTATLASIIYATSFSVILSNANGLNPDFSPPFTILMLYCIYKIINKKTSYIILLSVSVSFLLSFHPSGVFVILPIIYFYAKYKPQFSKRHLFISLLAIFILLVVPYGIQEKKSNGYTIKKTFSYIMTGKSDNKSDIISEEESSTSTSYINNVVNLPYVLGKNVSILLINNSSSIFSIFGAILVSLILIIGIASLKLQKKDHFVEEFLLLYIIQFGFLLKFSQNQTLNWWFSTTFIPTIVILIAKYVVKHDKYCILCIITGIFLIINTINQYLYIPKIDSFYNVTKITSILKEDSKSEVYDIYGTDPRPFYYYLWYTESDESLKKKYFKNVNYFNEKTNKLVYYIEYKTVIDKKRIEFIKKYHNLANIRKIAEINDKPIYRFY